MQTEVSNSHGLFVKKVCSPWRILDFRLVLTPLMIDFSNVNTKPPRIHLLFFNLLLSVTLLIIFPLWLFLCHDYPVSSDQCNLSTSLSVVFSRPFFLANELTKYNSMSNYDGGKVKKKP